MKDNNYLDNFTKNEQEVKKIKLIEYLSDLDFCIEQLFNLHADSLRNGPSKRSNLDNVLSAADYRNRAQGTLFEIAVDYLGIMKEYVVFADNVRDPEKLVQKRRECLLNNPSEFIREKLKYDHDEDNKLAAMYQPINNDELDAQFERNLDDFELTIEEHDDTKSKTCSTTTLANERELGEKPRDRVRERTKDG